MTTTVGAKTYCLSPTRVYDPELGRFLQRDPLLNQSKVVRGAGGNALGIYARTVFGRVMRRSSAQIGSLYGGGFVPNRVDAFGDQVGVPSGPATNIPNDFQFQSNWMTFTIGNDRYCFAPGRVYLPSIGSWLSRDPLADAAKVTSSSRGSTGGIFGGTVFFAAIMANLRRIRSLNRYSAGFIPNAVDPLGFSETPPGPPPPPPPMPPSPPRPFLEVLELHSIVEQGIETGIKSLVNQALTQASIEGADPKIFEMTRKNLDGAAQDLRLTVMRQLDSWRPTAALLDWGTPTNVLGSSFFTALAISTVASRSDSVAARLDKAIHFSKEISIFNSAGDIPIAGPYSLGASITPGIADFTAGILSDTVRSDPKYSGQASAVFALGLPSKVKVTVTLSGGCNAQEVDGEFDLKWEGKATLGVTLKP